MTEPDLSDDIEEMEDAVETALEALTEVKAYTLKADELADFKAAQYALRNIINDYDRENVAELYEVDLLVTGDESDY